MRWLRWRLRRTPALFWAAAAATSLLTASTVSGALAEADALAHRYGAARHVPVAVRSVAAGQVIGPGDVERRPVPAAFVPTGRLPAGNVTGRVARVALHPGEVVLAAKVAPDGLTGAAALLPPGRLALAVPVAPGTPPLAVGDQVDLLATFPPESAEAAGVEPTFAVAEAARVVAVDDDAVTVAVHRDESARLAYALATGVVTIALTSPTA